jgi:quercetin dioxygenase-like cupin family protein
MRVVNVVSAVAVTFVLGCSGAEAPVEYPDAVTADPDHYSVEYENDALRILRIAYGPGESSVMHNHPANCAIFLRDQAGTMESADGEVTQTTPAEAGTVTCASESAVHLPTNTSGADLELVLVEFKDGMTGSDAMPEAPHAVMADPDHYSVEFENDVARLVRVGYGPGETSVMHHHPAYCSVILVQVAGVTFELADGSVEDAPGGDLGELSCVDAQVHSPTNAGDGDLEAILIELKGRATAG